MASKKTRKGPRPKAAASAPDSPLLRLRGEIDNVDAQIHALLNDRARLARQVGVS